MPRTNNNNVLKTRTVYVISSLKTNLVYIGSTSESLSIRLSKHKTNKDCLGYKIIELGDYKISPLCIVNNCSRAEILLKEKDYLNFMKDIIINKIDTCDSYNKNYVAPNKQLSYKKQLLRESTKVLCSVCNSYITHGRLKLHSKTLKHQTFLSVMVS